MQHKNDNRFVTRYTNWIIRRRWLVIAISVFGVFGITTGVRHLEAEQNYRIFFGKENPQLLAFDAYEAMYSSVDICQFVVHDPDGSIFDRTGLTAIHELTEKAWQLPLSSRVDSLTNYPYSYGEDDDLIVEDLVPFDDGLTDEIIARAEEVAKTDPAVAGNHVSRDGDTAVVFVNIRLPEGDQESVGVVVRAARELRDEMRSAYPNLRFEVTGTVPLSDAFGQAPNLDARTVFPAMFALLVVFLLVFTRSLSGTLSTLSVITLSTMAGMGAAGYYGYGVNPANLSAPVIIMTLAIADSIHILMSMFKEMRKGSPQIDALRESMRINAFPVFLTSVSTAIGFLVLNFSDSPPFQELGNITATGVGFAYVLSVTFLPALLSILPVRVSAQTTHLDRLMAAIAEFNIRHRKGLAAGLSVAILVCMGSIVRMEINDTPHQYFDESVDFRRATDFMNEQRGFYPFYISVPSGESGGINDPAYLSMLDRFGDYLREQPGVVHVFSFADVSKRLNRNLHGEDPAYYNVPESRELAAQYLLLYEMSLPFGLDLNDQINVDKSATRVIATFRGEGLHDIKAAAGAAEAWLREQNPGVEISQATGPPVLFAHITETNIYAMIRGTLVGFVLIGILLMVSLKNKTLGLISLVPNLLPAATAFGIWAIFVGEAGFAISVVAGLSIGIIVDDTVHFLSKYGRARNELGLSSEEAVRYAFNTVGQALLSTSIVVAGGFAVLTLSSFRVTSFMGALTSLTVVCALVADFFLLPSILLLLDRRVTVVDEANPRTLAANGPLEVPNAVANE